MSSEAENRSTAYKSIQSITDAIRPVSIVEEGSGGMSPSGTACIVADGARRFVLTSHHVVSGPQSKYFGVDGKGSTRWPPRYSRLAARSQGLPEADVAWAVADGETNAIDLGPSIPFAQASAVVPDTDGATYLAVGFPVSKSKMRDARTLLAAKQAVVSATLCEDSVYLTLRLDKRVQMALSYSQSDRTDLLSEPAVGPNPTGMSGGAVVALLTAVTTKGTLTFPVVVGILTHFHL